MGHYLRIHDDYDEIRLALVCAAAPGSPCRLRPADGREEWTYADADLIDSGVCWAVEWADDGGWETVAAAEGVTWPMIPVTVEYEYEMGPVVAPVIPQPDLPIICTCHERIARATAAEVASRGYREWAEREIRGLHQANMRVRRRLRERAEAAEAERDALCAQVESVRQLAREVASLPSKYTRAPGENGDRVADLSEDAYRLGAAIHAALTPPTTTEETTHE